MQYKIKKQYRYKGYDYSQFGYYFVTICTKDRKLYFGDIKDKGKHDIAFLRPTNIGDLVDKYWREIPLHFPAVALDEYIIMPNHIHGIIVINGGNAPRRVPTGLQPLVINSLSSIINHFKGKVKKYCNKNDLGSFVWQPKFYDRIIRNEEELNRIRQYITNNPLKWELDRNDSENLLM